MLPNRSSHIGAESAFSTASCADQISSDCRFESVPNKHDEGPFNSVETDQWLVIELLVPPETRGDECDFLPDKACRLAVR